MLRIVSRLQSPRLVRLGANFHPWQGTRSLSTVPVCFNLQQRELLADCTSSDLDALVAAEKSHTNDSQGGTSATVSAYLGFDPTAASLHVGNLATIMAMRVLQRDHGIRPVLLVGSATAMVGDPSGRSTERPLLDTSTIEKNANNIADSLRSLLDFDSATTGARVVNNLDWYSKLNILDYLRDTALNFRIGTMLGKDSVRNRLQEGEQGLSLTEFVYMTLQAEDFRRLYGSDRCVIQVGGSDQWGNITAGVELVRRTLRKEVAGITVPLITTAAGEKLGKSAGNAVWLDSALTSHYDFYQYWLRTQDADVERLLKVFTDLSMDQIAEVMATHSTAPEARTAQTLLADEATRLVRGEQGRRQAVLASRVLFGGEAPSDCLAKITAESRDENSANGTAEDDLAQVFAGCDPVQLGRQDVIGNDLFHTLKEAGVVPSRKQFNRLLSAGGLYLNNSRVQSSNDEALRIMDDDLILDRFLLLRSGKKNYTVVEVV